LKGEDYDNGSPGRRPPFLSEYFPASFLALTAGYCSLIFYLSSTSSPPFDSPFIFFDKIVHFILYGGLGAVVALGLSRSGYEYSAKARIIVPVAFCLLYGISDETHQLFVSQRTFDVADIVADAAGAVTAAALLFHLRRETKSKP
jgi:VanZ family protein